MSLTRAAALLTAAAVIGGCGSGAEHHSAPTAPAKPQRAGGGIPASLLAGMRTVGRGERFHPPATGPVLGPCRATLGPRTAAHVELFGDNHVVLIAIAIGTRPPRRAVGGRLTHAGCFGSLVTLDPTGTVYVRRGAHETVADLFRSWGEPLSATRIASFTGGRVQVFIAGRRRPGPPGSVPLTPGSEIVLEVGPHVPPHRAYTFPPTPSPSTG